MHLFWDELLQLHRNWRKEKKAERQPSRRPTLSVISGPNPIPGSVPGARIHPRNSCASVGTICRFDESG